MSNKRTKNAEINEQRSRKRSLPINSPNEVNKKKNDGPARRYKVLLTCLICNGAAHGN